MALHLHNTITIAKDIKIWYSGTSIIQTLIIRTIQLSGLFSLVPISSRILISCDLENSKSQKAQ